MKMILCLIILLFLGGCSSLSKEDCLNQNWFELGKTDAMKGNIEPKTAKYRRECSEFGLRIKSMEYLKGFEVGLKKHCTYYNGLSRGRGGDKPHSLCDEVNPKYQEGYLEGLRNFKIVEIKNKLISENGGEECSFSSDCKKAGLCVLGKCEESQKECSSDSECETEGECGSVSEWTEFNDNVSVNVCRY